MTLNEAIQHCDEQAKTCDIKECANEHAQLRDWLIELREYRNRDRLITASMH